MEPFERQWTMWSIVRKTDQNKITATFNTRSDCISFLNSIGRNPDDYIIDYCIVLSRDQIVKEIPNVDFSKWH